MAAASVLITVMEDTVDYCSTGDVSVTIVDYNHLDDVTILPDEVERVLKELRGLSRYLPWYQDVMASLKERKLAAFERLALGAPPPPTEPSETDEPDPPNAG